MTGREESLRTGGNDLRGVLLRIEIRNVPPDAIVRSLHCCLVVWSLGHFVRLLGPASLVQRLRIREEVADIHSEEIERSESFSLLR